MKQPRNKDNLHNSHESISIIIIIIIEALPLEKKTYLLT